MIARSLLVLVASALVAACGAADAKPGTAPPVAVAATRAPTLAPAPAATPSPIPTAAPATPAPTPPPATPQPAPPPPPPPASTTQTFAILPLVAGGPGGSVTVTTSGGSVQYHVVVTGLAPFSAHAVHDHLGGCGRTGASQHLAVLAIRSANANGALDFSTTVGPFLAGSGRIVIVYMTPNPNLITGCADL